MKIFDCHIHLFTRRIIDSIVARAGLVQELNLNIDDIDSRLSAAALTDALSAAGVCGALMLPTADVAKIAAVNRESVRTAGAVPCLHTAGTLHPGYEDIDGELSWLAEAGVRVIKFCSFSQKFSLSHPQTYKMFDRIQSFNAAAGAPFAVILDTLRLADRFFGTNPEHTTTPLRLMDLVRRYPGVRFIGAHMGGLGAPFGELERHLLPKPNLFLDTSNAAHTLSEDQFVRMLRQHGPEHVLFGTDWPWFSHNSEIDLIDARMETAGFSAAEKQAVFRNNIEKLLGIAPSVDG